MFGSPFNNKETSYLCLDKDDNIDSLRVKLEDVGKTDNLSGFSLLNALIGLNDESIRTGRYAISSEQSLFKTLRRVRNHAQEPVRLVIPSVRTMEELAERVSEYLMLDSTTIVTALKDSAFCSSLGYTVETIPALFIPNTYELYWDVSLDGFFERMKKENDAFWTDERENKAKAMGMTKEEVITLASIVDEETANNGEKPRIAGLYLNRLKEPMPLQSDPTVKFAIGDFSLKRILHNHLDVDSPYNTYRNEGLPPGPIRIPSIAGIDAVLNHENHNFLYMCAKEDFSGTHNFAETYNEHLANARRYTDALDKIGIK